MNQIHCGDNLDIMHSMPDESVDLIYLDPPFFSGRNYEVIWGDEAEKRSFDDRWDGGIMVYINWMKERLTEMHRILKPTGSIYLHVDHHAVHYLKVEMDNIFGMKNFRNEIIWHYPSMSNTKKDFPRKHDNILRYTKSNEWTFNPDSIRIEYSESTKGRLSKDGTLKDGYFSGQDKEKVRTLNLKGKIPDTVFNIPHLSSQKERLGYPTQKPEALLERIIKASSNENDVVFDPFCGCGTTIAVARKFGRQYIGIDISPIACKLISERVNYPLSDIIGLPRTSEEIGNMEPHEFQNWVCQKMYAKNTSPDAKKASGADGGVDGVMQTPLTFPEYHRAPIQVKQSKGVGINTVKNFFATMHGLKKDIGFIVALSFGKGAKELVAKYKNEGSVTIYLLTVEDIIDKTIFDDIASNLK